MGAMDFMEPIVRNAMQNQARSELDYIGSDGLLFCGKCLLCPLGRHQEGVG